MPDCRRSWSGAALAIYLALVFPAFATPEACEGEIAAAARTVGVPEAVLHAISLTETGRLTGGRLRPWPWAVNREGQGFWFNSREDALAFARKSLQDGRPSFDIGCFQINYHWHGTRFPSLEAMADPKAGALYAARFLRELHGEFGNWTAAAGAYHSRTPEHAQRYKERFSRILASLHGGAPLLSAPVPPQPPVARRRVRAPLIITVPPARAGATPVHEPVDEPDVLVWEQPS